MSESSDSKEKSPFNSHLLLDIEDVNPFIADLLSPIDSNRLAQTNHEQLDSWRQNIDYWRLKTIGTDFQALLNPDETYAQAYARHAAIIQPLTQTPLNSPSEVAARLSAYPHYHSRRILTDADFEHVAGCVYTLNRFVIAHPKHANRVLDHLLSHDVQFFRIIRAKLQLDVFSANHPKYAKRALAKALKSMDFDLGPLSMLTALVEECASTAEKTQVFECLFRSCWNFKSVIRNPSTLKEFNETYPEMAERAGQCYLEFIGKEDKLKPADGIGFFPKKSSSTDTDLNENQNNDSCLLM